jgi:hypothetical protein
MIRRIAVALVLAALVTALGGLALAPSAVSAQDDDLVVTTTTGQVEGFGHIIPLPNSGTAPRSATDRGGWAQFAVLGGIVGGVCLIGGLVFLESRRKRARQQT